MCLTGTRILKSICDIFRLSGLNEATHRANAAKIRENYASAASVGVSRSSQARPAIMQSMESMLETWSENQVKRDSSANIMAVKAKTKIPFEDFKKDFPREANLKFAANIGIINRFNNRHSFAT
jgi:hypothetical protein